MKLIATGKMKGNNDVTFNNFIQIPIGINFKKVKYDSLNKNIVDIHGVKIKLDDNWKIDKPIDNSGIQIQYIINRSSNRDCNASQLSDVFVSFFRVQ